MICPLTGLPCNQEKCIHVTDVKDYKAENVLHLCKICGTQKVVENQPVDNKDLPKAVVEFITMLDALFKEKLFPKASNDSTYPATAVPPPMPANSCSQCGFTLDDIAKQARIGCGQCYTHFGKELLPVIQIAHGSVKHVGKVPKEWLRRKQEAEAKRSSKELLTELKKDMQKCLSVEDYEQAAILRDKIREIENKSPEV